MVRKQDGYGGLDTMKIACIIPARLKSQRFPRKILASLWGKPLIERVFEQAKKVKRFDTITFAVDAQETLDLVHSFGASGFLTSENHPSGTLRLAELQHQGKVKADIYVNWQADEPFITPQMIETLLSSSSQDNADVWTLKKKITHSEEISSFHVPKVVTDQDGFALYFSRHAIPFYRDSSSSQLYFKHIGLYAYRATALAYIATWTPSYLEKAEQLEQLTFLYHGLKIKVQETQEEVLGIDLPEHLERANRYPCPPTT